MVLDLEEKTFFLVTGASRGIGQTMAVEVAKKLAAGSVIVLIARCEEGLVKTKSAIESNGKALKVFTYSIDLGQATAERFSGLLKDCLKKLSEKAENFQRAFIIHNAGTVGDVSKRAIDCPTDIQIWSQFYYVNVFSVIALNSEFYHVFTNVPKLVINISSKCGIEPFASMSFYCSSKAARDMYFRVLAIEEPDSLVLNYAPGAIDTDMSRLVQEQSINKELVTQFKELRESKTMLTPQETTDKFLTILHEQKFLSGDHVDYWD